MALLLRSAVRPCLRQATMPLRSNRSQMGTTAQEQMKVYWKKNLTLNRPNSPWLVYEWHLPMCTSLCHRVTGVVMGVALYGMAVGYAVAKSVNIEFSFSSLVQWVKELNIPQPVRWVLKTLMAFPLCYHYINGIRHLTWDYGRGFLLSTQYKSGSMIVVGSILLAATLASLAYM